MSAKSRTVLIAEVAANVVTTEKGDYVLDNQNDAVLLRWRTGYYFVNRQSQTNPQVFVSLGDPRPRISPQPRPSHLIRGPRIRRTVPEFTR
jgi:hypothetical protein